MSKTIELLAWMTLSIKVVFPFPFGPYKNTVLF